MKYKTVYDLNNKRFTSYYVTPVIFFVISVCLFIASVYTDFFSEMWKISFGILTVSFGLWSLLNLFQMIADEHYIIIPYRNGSCEVVEGIVSSIHEKSRLHSSESFEISGLKFYTPNTSSRIGYNVLKRQGGVITGAGQNVRITYVFNKMLGNDMVVVKIEIAE